MQQHDYSQLGSTSDEARVQALAHPGQMLVVTSAVQTAGRGRLGRPWQSPRGGLWMSVVWPTSQPLTHYSNLPLIAALALHRSIEAITPAQDRHLVSIKWPNDLLLAGRKIAGVLCETVLETTPPAIIIGIGVNANFPSADLPADLRFPATTLRDYLHHDINLAALKDAILTQLITLLREFEQQGFSPASRDELTRHLAFLGQQVAVQPVAVAAQQPHPPSPRHTQPSATPSPITGRIAGLDPQGRLLLETQRGLVSCDAGEVTQLRPT